MLMEKALPDVGTSPALPPLKKLLKKKKKKKKKPQKKQAQFLVSTTAFRGNLECLRAALTHMAGWGEELRSDARRLERCAVMWIGKDMDQMRYGGSMDLQMLTRRGQYASRIDGMREIACKDATAECVERLRALFPEDPEQFAFAPRSWRLPLEGLAFERALKRNTRKKSKEAAKETYIIKPAAGSEGNGIFLAQSLHDVPASVLTDCSYSRSGFVAQEYIARPMTLDGFKFDLRLCKCSSFIHSFIHPFTHSDGGFDSLLPSRARIAPARSSLLRRKSATLSRSTWSSC